MATSSTPKKRRTRASTSSTTLTIRLERGLDDRLQDAAKAARRPVSQVIREAAEAYLESLQAPQAAAAQVAPQAVPVPTWAVDLARRLDALEAAAKVRETAQRDALARIDRRVEIFAVPLRMMAEKLGVKFPQAQAQTQASKTSTADVKERLMRASADLK